MWRNALRDLQWRRRRFAIAVLGTALVFAMTLILSGLSESFRAESRRTHAALGAHSWVIEEGASGPFTALVVWPQSLADDVGADPLLIFRQTLQRPARTDVMVIGHLPGRIGTPPVTRGRTANRPGEVVADQSLKQEIGNTLVLGSLDLRVVGLTKGLTSQAGTPNVYVTLPDFQSVVFRGQSFITAMATARPLRSLPDGFTSMSSSEVIDDQLRPLENAVQAIDLTQMLLWLVAAMIIGSVVYLTAIERLRDFAVFKSTGAGRMEILGSLASQAVILALVSAVVSVALSAAIVPAFPLPVAVPLRAYGFLAVMSVVVGVIASGFGVRRALTVDPALAFGASS